MPIFHEAWGQAQLVAKLLASSFSVEGKHEKGISACLDYHAVFYQNRYATRQILNGTCGLDMSHSSQVGGIRRNYQAS